MRAGRYAPGIWLLMGGLLLAQGEDILNRVQRALAASNESAAGVSALRARDFKRVDAMLSSAKAETDSERAELLALRGSVAFLSGNMAAASEKFLASERLAPAKEGDRFTLAMAQVKLGDTAGARRLISSLANEHPGSAIYRYWWGRLDYDQRRYREAVEKLRQATELDPKSARAWDSLGLAFDMQGQAEAAREAFTKAVTLNRAQGQPSAWPAHNLGSLLLRLGELQPAETALKESLQYDPKLGRTHFYLARLFEKQGREPQAVEEYKSAVRMDPQSPDGCYALALLYRKMHKDAEADEMFSEFKRRKETGG